MRCLIQIIVVLAPSIVLATNLYAATHIAIVQGLAGEEYYQGQFDEQVAAIKAESEQLATAENVQLFSGEAATKENLNSWFKRVAENASSTDRVAFYYVGHGSYDETGYKFNILGPDLSGQELKQAYDAIPAELKLIVNTSSASGALIEIFEEAAKTILITATKNGRERNATRFGRFLTQAFTNESADLDKNELVSVKEAYEFAHRQTQDFYTSEGLIATEHAVLKGEHANLFSVASLANRLAIEQSPQLIELYEQRDEIDLDIERLRLRRIGMSEGDYRQAFQALMIKLSLLQVEIDDLQGVEGGDP